MFLSKDHNTPGDDARPFTLAASSDLVDEIFVAGEWQRGSGDIIETIDPASGSVFAHLHGGTVDDIDRAVRGGAKAVERSGWGQMLAHERARVLYRVGDLIENNIERIAGLQTLDTGKTLRETRALAASAAGTFRYVAAALETMEGAVTPARGPYLTLSLYEPVGVVAAITPWNSPIASDAQKIAPALAAGNAVVLKPPVRALWVSLLLARLCEEAGLPSGLLSVIPGPGRVLGDALTRHPGVGKITFTGGTTTGRQIAHAAAERMTPVTLELGGKSPTIVFADADIDQAIAGVLFGVFSSSGQSCIAGSRVFIESSIYDQFLTRLAAAAQNLRVGPGWEDTTQVAPMIDLAHRNAVAKTVSAAIASGARAVVGGEIPASERLGTGAYYPPTILTDVENTADICQEEVFGPVAVVLPFSDEADLINQANDTVYGLACGIWTADFPRAYRIARSIDAGTVWVNTYKQFSISTPFSGTKDSGLGTEKGRDGIRSYMRQKSIYVDLSGKPIPWSETKKESTQ